MGHRGMKSTNAVAVFLGEEWKAWCAAAALPNVTGKGFANCERLH